MILDLFYHQFKPSAPAEITPTTFDPPDIKFKGKGFHQYGQIGMPKLVNLGTTVKKYNNRKL